MNTRMQDDVFDLVLKYALLDCSNEDVSTLKQKPKTDCTEAFSQTVTKLVSKRKRALTLMAVPKWTRRTAACFIMVFSVFSAVLLTAPPVQAAVQEVVVEWTDRYVNFSFTQPRGDSSIKEIRFTYLPDGFEEKIRSISPQSISRLKFEDSNSAKIELLCLPASEGCVGDIDNEHGEKATIAFNKSNVLFLKSVGLPYPNYLTWTENKRFFNLMTPYDLPEAEIIKVAENIVLKFE